MRIKRVNENIGRETHLIKRQALAKCNKFLSQVESLSKKYNFELSCVFGHDGWNVEYSNINIMDTTNSLQSLLYAITTVEFHRDNAMSVCDINTIIDDAIRCLNAFKEDKINEVENNRINP